jgi:TatD DNase family protein
MALIDFHCHVTEAGGYAALPKTSTLFQDAPHVIAVTNRPSDWAAMARTKERGVTWAIGLHPELHHQDADVDELIRLAPGAEAIGEVGLDYSSHSKASPHEQRRALQRVLAADATRRRLVSLHSRGATGDVVAALADARVPGAILHWFLGSPVDVERAVDIDVFFSVNEAMVRSQRGRAVIDLLPPNRVLLETDAPFGGSRRSIRPGDLEPTVRSLAKHWHRQTDDVVKLIERNQQTLLARVARPRSL